MFPLLNHASKARTTGSALSPILWCIAFSAAFTAALFTAGADGAATIAFSLTIALFFFFVGVYIFLLVYDRDRLHSEQHIQQMSRMLMGDSVSGHPRKTIETTAVGNPALEMSDELRQG